MEDCVCYGLLPGTKVFWCPNHKTWKTPHWATLCQTRPAYRAAWVAGRGPGQIHGAGPLVEAASGDGGGSSDLPAWLACDQRGPVETTLMARDFGCGCGTIALHRCERFGELVLLKMPQRLRRPIEAEGFGGRDCARCRAVGEPGALAPRVGMRTGERERAGEPGALAPRVDRGANAPPLAHAALAHAALAHAALAQNAPKKRRKIKPVVPGPSRPGRPLTERYPLDAADRCLSQRLDRGIITGGSAVHWPCLGALAIAAAEQGLGFAVADHGLEDWQRAELDRVGVRWLQHAQPDLATAQARHRIPSDLRAWWKPWICAASPFELSVWIDSDAVCVAELDELYSRAAQAPCVSTQRLWQGLAVELYEWVVAHAIGDWARDDVLPRFADVNSGVLAWRAGAALIAQWRAWCERLIVDGEAIPHCRVRDQTGMVCALIDRAIRGGPCIQLLEDRYNVPADWLPSRQSTRRQRISLRPAELLEQARQRHAGAVVVHWLGGVKPWKI